MTIPTTSRAGGHSPTDRALTSPRHVYATDRTRTFAELHESGCFVIPNPWDVGSARASANSGFPALATPVPASPGPSVSPTIGLARRRAGTPPLISSSFEIPVNADFECGFAIEPDDSAPTSRSRRKRASPDSPSRFNRRRAESLFDLALSVEPSEPLGARSTTVTRAFYLPLARRIHRRRPDLAQTIRD